MKARFAKQRCHALTFIELLVVLLCLAVLVAMLLPILAAAKRRASRINCVSQLKQDALAARIWEGDNNNLYPMQVAVTNGGAMELIATNNVAGFFQVMSNELSTPKILICPEDKQVIVPTNGFDNRFCNKNISYFVGLDANENYPQRLLFGDDNFEINGPPIPSGVAQISTNALIAWGTGRHDDVTRIPYLGIPLRHNYFGNLCFADGSVSQDSSNGLHEALIQTGVATNRLAIP